MSARFYLARTPAAGERLTLTGDDAHHAVRVLRLSPGDDLRLVGPDGAECAAEVENVDASVPSLRALVRTCRRPDREPRLRVTVAQALIKGDKFDHVVQKGTELGAVAFVPFAAARSVVRLPESKAVGRLERWRRIVAAAAAQSGRLVVPQVHPMVTLERLAVFASESDLCLLAWEGETDRGLFDVLTERLGGRGAAGPGARILLIIGPEGGFSPAEVETLGAAGAVTVSIGSLILRTETAAPSILAMMLYHAGDLGRAPADAEGRS